MIRMTLAGTDRGAMSIRMSSCRRSREAANARGNARASHKALHRKIFEELLVGVSASMDTVTAWAVPPPGRDARLYRPTDFFIAAVIDWRIFEKSAQGPPSRRSERFSTVKVFARTSPSSSSQKSGVETGAPARARVE